MNATVHRLSLLAVVMPALALGGCVSDPYNDARATATPTAQATVGAGPRASAPTPAEAATSPRAAAPVTKERAVAPAIEAAVRRFAERYVNWDWDTMGKSRRQLAALAAGRLHDELLANATAIGAEAARRPSEQANTGVVEGVLVRRGKPVYVITRETATFGEGAGQEGVFVYVAEVERAGSAWKLTVWRGVSG